MEKNEIDELCKIRTDELLKDFHDYDDAITIVSCWKIIFNFEDYKDNFSYFDWFPKIPHADNPLTPDFTSCFKANYGIIGEVKSSFPRDDAAFDSELEQIKKYDDITQIRNTASSFEKIDKLDILLFVHRNRAAEQIAKRIIEKLNDPKHSFKIKNRLTIIDYSYSETQGKDYFVMHRITLPGNGEPLEPKLSNIIVAQLKSIQIPPHAFLRYKSEYLLMNDSPPVIYMLTFLWNEIFKLFLTDEDRDKIANSTSLKYQIQVDSNSVKDKISRLLPDNIPISKKDINDCLNELCKIGKAKYSPKEQKYMVEYKNLSTRNKTPDAILNETNKELAYIFAQYISKAENKVYETKDNKILKPINQLELFKKDEKT